MIYCGYKDNIKVTALALEPLTGPDYELCVSTGKTLYAGRHDSGAEYLLACEHYKDVISLSGMGCKWYQGNKMAI